jgi:hypothetical protein
MKFWDIFLALFIIFTFMICTLVTYLANGIKYIEDNWILYRCNPLIMPFSSWFGHDADTNFGVCVGEMQKSSMPIHLAPLTAGHHAISSSMGQLHDKMQSVRKLQSKLRPAIASNFFSVFNIFGNVIVAFHQFINGFKDLLMRLLAIMASMLYLIQGQGLIGESVVKGPLMGAITVLSLGQIH